MQQLFFCRRSTITKKKKELHCLMNHCCYHCRSRSLDNYRVGTNNPVKEEEFCREIAPNENSDSSNVRSHQDIIRKASCKEATCMEVAGKRSTKKSFIMNPFKERFQPFMLSHPFSEHKKKEVSDKRLDGWT